MIIVYIGFWTPYHEKKLPIDSVKLEEGSSNRSIPSTAIYNVQDFGAKGNAEADDTKSIIEAVRAAEADGGGTVVFDKGTYLVTALISIPENVSILGAGELKTTLKRKDKRDEAIFKLLGNQVVQDIGFFSRIGVLPVGDDISILHAKFECRIQGIQNAVTVHRLTVMNVLFTHCGYGILSNQNPSFDVKIINCRFLNTMADGIEINTDSESWLIENCLFDTNSSQSKWSGFGIGIAKKAKDVVIRNSAFIDIIGQGVHAEDYAEVTIIGSSFQNCGADSYKGSPEADIAVLSHAIVKVINCTFFASDEGYSNLAIYNTVQPVGGTVLIKSSKLYNKEVSKTVITENVEQ